MAGIMYIALGLIFGAGILLIWLVLKFSSELKDLKSSNDKNESLLLLQQQIDNLRSQLEVSIDRLVTNVTSGLNQITGQVGERLDNTTTLVGNVQRQLGSLEQVNQHILEVSKDISSLQEILKPPKMRGGMGELLLQNLMHQVMPKKEYYSFEHTFKSGDRVDAVIKIGDRMVPVDSKFPLESFKRVIDSKDEEERLRSRKEFERDVKKHIDAIADKYILPDEGTYEFALMYIPAENVYYESIIKYESSGKEGIFEHALSRKVIPVSPNSFYAYLQVIMLGLKGLAIEQGTREVIEALERLQGDFSRFREDFRKIGVHVTDAQSSFASADKRLVQFGAKLKELENPKEIRIHE